jgi:hypothetical protein
MHFVLVLWRIGTQLPTAQTELSHAVQYCTVVYIYLIYLVRNHENNSISGDTHDLFKEHKNRFEEVSYGGSMWSWFLFPLFSRSGAHENKNRIQSYLSNIIFVVRVANYCRQFLLTRVQLFYLSTFTYIRLYFIFSKLPTEIIPVYHVNIFFVHIFSYFSF